MIIRCTIPRKYCTVDRSHVLRDSSILAPRYAHFQPFLSYGTVLPFWPLHRNLASNDTRTRFLVCYNAIEQLHGVLKAFSSFFHRYI